MRKWLLLGLSLLATAAGAQTAAINGFCTQGGQSALVQGLNSTNKLQGIVPSCTVSVFLTGTTTPATIFADSLSTPLANPFTATALGSAAPGQWLFYAATGQGYDVVLSGGISPLVFAQPVTLSGLFSGGSGGGGSTVIETNGTPISPASPANFANSASVTWSSSGGVIQAVSTGGGGSSAWDALLTPAGSSGITSYFGSATNLTGVVTSQTTDQTIFATPNGSVIADFRATPYVPGVSGGSLFGTRFTNCNFRIGFSIFPNLPFVPGAEGGCDTFWANQNVATGQSTVAGLAAVFTTTTELPCYDIGNPPGFTNQGDSGWCGATTVGG